MSHNNNPYAQAAGTYDTNAQAHTGNQRELEARILIKSNRQIQAVIDNWDNRGQDDLADALKYNRQIWTLFYDTAIENKDGDRPNDLRSNIVNLANFIFKREMDVLSNPQKEKLEILLNINREISAGLMTQVENAQKAEAQHPPQNHQATDISG